MLIWFSFGAQENRHRLRILWRAWHDIWISVTKSLPRIDLIICFFIACLTKEINQLTLSDFWLKRTVFDHWVGLKPRNVLFVNWYCLDDFDAPLERRRGLFVHVSTWRILLRFTSYYTRQLWLSLGIILNPCFEVSTAACYVLLLLLTISYFVSCLMFFLLFMAVFIPLVATSSKWKIPGWRNCSLFVSKRVKYCVRSRLLPS